MGGCNGRSSPQLSGCTGRGSVGTDNATWYFVRHAQADSLGSSPDQIDVARVLAPDAKAHIATKRNGWICTEGLDTIIQANSMPQNWHVVSSPASRCIETAKFLFMIDELMILPVTFLYDGLRSEEFADLYSQFAHTPLQKCLEANQMAVRAYGQSALEEIVCTVEDFFYINTVVVVGHAIGLGAAALELAEMRELDVTELLNIVHGEVDAFKVSMDGVYYMS